MQNFVPNASFEKKHFLWIWYYVQVQNVWWNEISLPPGPVFCLLLGVSSDCAQPITGQVTEVTCPVIGQTQPELTLSKRQKTGPELLDPLSKQTRQSVSTWRPPQNGHHFTDIFGAMVLKENCISIQISLKFGPRTKLRKKFIPLVQVIAWHQTSDKPFKNIYTMMANSGAIIHIIYIRLRPLHMFISSTRYNTFRKRCV